MGSVFVNAEGQLRNGWWMLVFTVVLFCLGVPATFAGSALRHAGVSGAWLTPSSFLVTLAATWLCTRMRREPLASVGFRLDRRWALEFAAGAGLGGAVMVLAAGLVWAAGGLRFELDPGRGAAGLLSGLYLFTLVAFFEETLFRGFLFQRLRDGLGVPAAQVLLALLFAYAHWGNPGMHGATKLWATLNIALAAVLLGLAYLRTHSLALPIGMHLGWNWTQGNLLGFGVSGTTDQPGWLRPVFLGKPDWVTGGTFGLEASVFGVVAVLLAIGLLWRWKGIRPYSAQGPLPDLPEAHGPLHEGP